MTLIVCIDNNGGMLFNNRRQSRDSQVCQRIVQRSENNRLLMNGYSAKLFEEGAVVVSEDLLKDASGNDVVFIENLDVSGAMQYFSRVIIYHWNRAYPSDLKFPLEELKTKFSLLESCDFSGSSHDLITEEVYVS